MLLLTTLAVAYRTPITFSRLAPPTTRLFSTQTTTKSAHLLPLPPTTTPLYLTTPIYYVNAPPHIGHAYTSLATDLISRYYTLSGGAPPYFLTGTDEHGEKVAANAESKGVPVQEFVDGVSEDFRRLLDVYNIRPDQFIRTTGEDHKRAAERFWEALDRNGDVYKGSYSGYYSVRDECYYTDSELVDAPNPDGSGGTIKVAPTGSPVVFKEKEETYVRASERCERNNTAPPPSHGTHAYDVPPLTITPPLGTSSSCPPTLTSCSSSTTATPTSSTRPAGGTRW